jgi:dolichyl-phosphate-mannose--protein O-mannosyl transferase
MRRRASFAAPLVAALACVVAALARAVAADADALVTCGSALKLKHFATSHALTSQSITYASGSGQQSVTAIPNDQGETDTYWIVHAAHGARCERGGSVKHGTKIRLQHANTRAWLHSHPHRSPLSGNQEVSAYGNDDVSNSGDEWVVELTSGAGANWVRGKKVRFRHVETGAYLVTHGMKFGRPIAGHQEVVGVPTPGGSNSIWMSVEGVYFPSDAENVGKEDL